jgi:hypothetical protein
MIANKAFNASGGFVAGARHRGQYCDLQLMESILLRSLPVADPESLVVLNWHSQPPQNANKEWVHVVHGIQGMFWPG